MRERILTPTELTELMRAAIKLIDGDDKRLPKINTSNGIADPYIEITQYGYEYVCNERGLELRRDLAFDLNDLLYMAFSDITCWMASDYEAANRNYLEDTRRMMFNKQVELMSVLSRKWGDKINREHLQIISSFPFNDELWSKNPHLKKEMEEQTEKMRRFKQKFE